MLNENWALLCEVGLWGWILSTAAMAIQVFARRDNFDKKYALLWGLAIAGFYTFWIYGMIHA
jgi:hypothetical protein